QRDLCTLRLTFFSLGSIWLAARIHKAGSVFRSAAISARLKSNPRAHRSFNVSSGAERKSVRNRSSVMSRPISISIDRCATVSFLPEHRQVPRRSLVALTDLEIRGAMYVFAGKRRGGAK